ncbi:MAG: PD-(D/E)XK nuclease family protein [Spirochaetes bacterium]|nr:PD-(D/E)XK nuclease family protein [Spirochaetota bacterium]
MKLVRLDFTRDPSRFAAVYIKKNKLHPQRTLVITPTERFKAYMARALLDTYGTEDAISPAMMKIGDLSQVLAGYEGRELANEMQKLNLLYNACGRTGGFEELFGKDVFSGFSSFQRLARGLLGAFEEINRMEADLGGGVSAEYYEGFVRHFEIFRRIYESYRTVQQERGLFDTGFLLEKVKERNIRDFFSVYDDVVFISPLLLTAFERRVFRLVEDKLHVIYQDTDEYDFSDLLTYRGPDTDEYDFSDLLTYRGQDTEHDPYKSRPANGSETPGRLVLHETSTRIETVMLVLSLIEKERDRGVEPHEIAVLNIDPEVCEMVLRSCGKLGIPANYTRGVAVRKAPVFVFLRLVGDFFDSGMDSAVLTQLVRSEFFCELSGLRDWKKLHERIIKGRVFSTRPLADGLLDEKSSEVLARLRDLYTAKGFDTLYKRLLSLFETLGGKRPFEFYTVRDMLLECVLQLDELAVALPESCFDIFLQYAASRRYTLKGAVGEGVQIVGLLETRGVSFRTVIVPTFNEGYFPTAPDFDMVFSSDLKKALGLLTRSDREKLEFYYLKRLLDASERAHLIPIRDSVGEFEIPSRYCHILSTEKGGGVPHTLPVPKRAFSAGPASDGPPRLTTRPGSYSRLDIHRLKRCETQYYIAKTLKIEGEKVLSKKIEMDFVGLLVHKFLRDLYGGLDFENLPEREEFERSIVQRFNAEFTDGLFGTREEVFARRILLENLKDSLMKDYERFREGTAVCGDLLERDFTATVGGFNLTGRIDRIDRSIDGGYTILDYKTGRVPDKKDHMPEKDYMEAQLGFYGLLFLKTFPDRRMGGLGYYDLSKNKDVVILVKGEEAKAYVDGFETHLVGFLERFEKKEGLSLAADMACCTYCPYYTICRVYDA